MKCQMTKIQKNKNGEEEMNIVAGMMAFVIGMVLFSSLALNLHTQHMLKQCREMLDFCIDLTEKKEERKELERIGREGTE